MMEEERHQPGLAIPPHIAPRIPFDIQASRNAIYGRIAPTKRKPRKLSQVNIMKVVSLDDLIIDL